jgi:hypothetical protein
MIISTSSFVAALIATAVSSALVGHTLTVSQRREPVPHHNFVDVNPCNFCDYDNASDEGFHQAEQDSNFIRL